jgi:hypothetical protein
MIIWRGCGIIIGIIGVMCLVFTSVGVNAVMRDPHFYQEHGWPKLIALWLAAALSWWTGQMMSHDEEPQPADPKSGQLLVQQPIVVRSEGEDSFFFIPVRYWWIVFLILGVVFAFSDSDAPAAR